MIKEMEINNLKVKTYIFPANNLSEENLFKLHKKLIEVNHSLPNIIKNKYLETETSYLKLKEKLQNMIISEIYVEEKVVGFLVSPILENGKNKILHLGLVIINENPGGNLIGLVGVQHIVLAYENFGSIFITNISSTPSIIENFSEICFSCWPSPNAKLRNCPSGYKEVVKILKEKYMDKFFPESNSLELDYKRFVLKSKSKKMGFSTDFKNLSKADKFKYNSFCLTWLSYESEEDLIQVGRITFFNYFYIKIVLWGLMYSVYTRIKKHKIKSNTIEIISKKAA